MRLGRPAAVVDIRRNTEIRIRVIAAAPASGTRGRAAASFLLVLADLLNAALVVLAVRFADRIEVEAGGAVFEDVAHDVAGGHLIHAEGEVDVLT